MKNSIKVERAIHDMTQEELAGRIAVSRQTIHAIEAGKYVPSTVLALKIARLFGKPVESIFMLEDGYLTAHSRARVTVIPFQAKVSECGWRNGFQRMLEPRQFAEPSVGQSGGRAHGFRLMDHVVGTAPANEHGVWHAREVGVGHRFAVAEPRHHLRGQPHDRLPVLRSMTSGEHRGESRNLLCDDVRIHHPHFSRGLLRVPVEFRADRDDAADTVRMVARQLDRHVTAHAVAEDVRCVDLILIHCVQRVPDKAIDRKGFGKMRSAVPGKGHREDAPIDQEIQDRGELPGIAQRTMEQEYGTGQGIKVVCGK